MDGSQKLSHLVKKTSDAQKHAVKDNKYIQFQKFHFLIMK